MAPQAPLALLSHTAAAASQAVAAPRASAAARPAVPRAAAVPRSARRPACAAAAAAAVQAPAAARERAQLPSRRAFLNGALKVSVASASLLSSIDDIAEAAPMHRSLSAAALAADAVHSPRAAAAGSLERSAAREFDHASMLSLPLKPFGGALSGGSAPASLAAAPSPVHQVCACYPAGPAPALAPPPLHAAACAAQSTAPDQRRCPLPSPAAAAVCRHGPG